jgi:hypothetical protein
MRTTLIGRPRYFGWCLSQKRSVSSGWKIFRERQLTPPRATHDLPYSAMRFALQPAHGKQFETL